MTYKVFHSVVFDKRLETYPKDFKEWLRKIEEQLVENPYVGDPLNVKWFREKKHDKFRIYYLIYDDLKAVYLIAISEKKDQQKVINTIRLLLDNFKEEMENILDGK